MSGRAFVSWHHFMEPSLRHITLHLDKGPEKGNSVGCSFGSELWLKLSFQSTGRTDGGLGHCLNPVNPELTGRVKAPRYLCSIKFEIKFCGDRVTVRDSSVGHARVFSHPTDSLRSDKIERWFQAFSFVGPVDRL